VRKLSSLFCLALLFSITLSGCNILVPESKQTTDSNFHPGVPANPGTTPVSTAWSFDALSEALYTYSVSLLQFTDGVVELIGTDQRDNTSTEFSTTSGGSLTGVAFGTLADGSSTGLKLDSTNPELELSANWTPQYSSIVGYWKMNGTVGVIANGATMAASVGNDGSTNNSNGTGMAHVSARINQGVDFDGTDDTVSVASTGLPTGATARTTSVWVKPSNAGSNVVYFWGLTMGSRANGIILSGGYVRYYGWANDCNATTAVVSLNNWNHIVTTYNGTSAKIYLNGVLQQTCAKSWNTGVGNLTIGYDGSNPRFVGTMDDLAIWNVALSDAEVAALYSRQSARYAGTFISRAMDALSSSSWTTLSWIPTLPFLKELPDSTCTPTPCAHNNTESNAPSGYTSLVGSGGTTATNDLMTGIKGLWHLNEVAATVGGNNDFRDDSGNANHGEISGGVRFGVGGKLDKAATFDGSSGYIAITESSGLPIYANTTYSLSFWVNGAAQTSKFIFAEGNSTTNTPQFSIKTGTAGNTNKIGLFIKNDATTTVLNSNSNAIVFNGDWHHIAWVDNNGAATLYIDGIADLTNFNYTRGATTLDRTSLGAVTRTTTGNFFAGSIDEVAVWSRALHANEIKQLYQRGASRLKHQVRTCAESTCVCKTIAPTTGSITDCDGDGIANGSDTSDVNLATWKGPDGTSGTYFSELNSNTDPLAQTGDVKATLPSMLFSAFTSPPSANQYFQYRTIFETDSATVADGPELKSVTVDPIHYPSYLSTDTSPGNTIIGVNGVAFYDLSAFTQTLGATNGCSSGVVYNIGLSSTGPWKYWTGAAWATSNGSSAQANTAATINTNAATFGSSVGRGSVYFKAFMQSSGTSKCELDNIAVGGNR